MARSPVATATRTAPVPQAEPQTFHVPRGRAVATGRDGKPVYRQITSSQSADPYAIPPEIVDPGWVYQWKRYSVYNQPDHTNMATLALGGWTPVPADRHDGRFLPPGTRGNIIRDGLILMERPLVLQKEAEAEEKRAADHAMRSAKSTRGLAAPAGAGVDTDTPAARAASFVRQVAATAEDIEAMAQVPRGNYERETNTID